jgi:hypothetical protein
VVEELSIVEMEHQEVRGVEQVHLIMLEDQLELDLEEQEHQDKVIQAEQL